VDDQPYGRVREYLELNGYVEYDAAHLDDRLHVFTKVAGKPDEPIVFETDRLGNVSVETWERIKTIVMRLLE